MLGLGLGLRVRVKPVFFYKTLVLVLVFVLMILAILNVFSHFTQICHVQNVLYLTLEGYLLDTQEICFEVGFCALLASSYPHVVHICLC